MFEESARLVVWLVPIILIAVIFLPQMIRILREYERGVIFRLGKLLGTKGPGLIFLIPIVDRMVRMDLRVVTIDVARQEVMTRDNVPMTVDAVVYFRVIDPASAVVRVENYLKATSLISQTTLRSVLGQAELGELLSQRDKINLRLQEMIDRQTDSWGIKVTAVEVRDVVLPDSMKRAMAGQAESERERRAKIINAEGVLLLADLAEAACGSVLQTSGQTEILKLLPPDQVRATGKKIAAKFGRQSSGLTPVERLLKWSVSDPRRRTISPFSKITVPEWIENRIKEGTFESVRAAIQMDPANAQRLTKEVQAATPTLPSPTPLVVAPYPPASLRFN
jgi:regulator of protease activity HflC (stomatin/prohibitin superfamily)